MSCVLECTAVQCRTVRVFDHDAQRVADLGAAGGQNDVFEVVCFANHVARQFEIALLDQHLVLGADQRAICLIGDSLLEFNERHDSSGLFFVGDVVGEFALRVGPFALRILEREGGVEAHVFDQRKRLVELGRRFRSGSRR